MEKKWSDLSPDEKKKKDSNAGFHPEISSLSALKLKGFTGKELQELLMP
jgi:hypothetical protein